MAIISFARGKQSKYDDIPSKNPDTLYICTDTKRMFIGEHEYTRAIKKGSALPEKAEPNSLYLVETDGKRQLHYTEDGSVWINILELPSQINGGTFGQNDNKELDYGQNFNIPKITVNNYGIISDIKDEVMKLPNAHTFAKELEITKEDVVKSIDKGQKDIVNMSVEGETLKLNITSGQDLSYETVQVVKEIE